jgi:hypothetical protein
MTNSDLADLAYVEVLHLKNVQIASLKEIFATSE